MPCAPAAGFACGLSAIGARLASMTLDEIRFTDASADRDSLPACLEAILRAAGSQVDYRSIHAALGLSFWIAAPRRKRCLGCWMSEGHDALLVDACRLFGVRLRELHPPEAAIGLEDSPEFRQHFEASYRPLMEIALGHRQPSLVRRGWPDPCGNLWGIVTQRREDGLGFAGVSPGGGDAPAPLTLPAVQVYVVEEIRPRAVAPREILRHVAQTARRVQTNQLDPRLGLLTGSAAYDAWLEQLKHDSVCPSCAQVGGACHERMADHVARNRETARELLAELKKLLPESRGMIEARESGCHGVIEALRRARARGTSPENIDSPSARAEWEADIRAARTHDERTAEACQAFE